WAGKRYWIVGASEGLGAALAHEMSTAGAHLILSARNGARLAELAAALPGPADIVPLDLAQSDDVQAAAEQIGDIDGVVHLAGVYWPMPATQWDAQSAETMADVNFTGTMRLMSAVVPKMVARNAGHIVITGSLSGFRGLPGAIGYAASKAGTMVLAESLYADLRKTGVQVQLVNPGFIRTRLTAKNDFAMPFIMAPDKAAQIFFRHMNTRKFQRSFPRIFSWVFRGGLFLPDRLYYRLFA
ncbi:MAG: SDR family NAD(P)-dependent oxidoreductase, partial [Primorskyibacter sp.]